MSNQNHFLPHISNQITDEIWNCPIRELYTWTKISLAAPGWLIYAHCLPLVEKMHPKIGKKWNKYHVGIFILTWKNTTSSGKGMLHKQSKDNTSGIFLNILSLRFNFSLLGVSQILKLVRLLNIKKKEKKEQIKTQIGKLLFSSNISLLCCLEPQLDLG